MFLYITYLQQKYKGIYYLFLFDYLLLVDCFLQYGFMLFKYLIMFVFKKKELQGTLPDR